MKKYLSFFIFIYCMVASACSTRITDYTIISTKNIEFSKLSSYKRINERTTGESKPKHAVLFIPLPPNEPYPNLKDAVDKAIEKTPGAVALVDGVVYLDSFSLLIYSQSKFRVQGTPLVDPSLQAKSIRNNDDDYMISFIDPKTNKRITLPVGEFDLDKRHSYK